MPADRVEHPRALVTGGSRGVGAATVKALATAGFDVLFTFRSKARRAEQVVSEATATARRVIGLANDMTSESDRQILVQAVTEWAPRLEVLVLNASGGLEKEQLAANPNYPMTINRDSQLALVNDLRPVLVPGADVVYVTSHWAHLYGKVAQMPMYEPIAASKHAGEVALRAELRGTDLRLIVVTGDLIEGTVTPKLLARANRDLSRHRESEAGALPTTEDMAAAIVAATLNKHSPFGHTVVVGGTLETVLSDNA